MVKNEFSSISKWRISVFLLLFCTFQPTFSFTQTSYFIRDLETNSQNRFINEVASWTSSVTLPNSVKYYKCAGDFILGGFNWSPGQAQIFNTLSRQYTGLPSHTVVKYSFVFWIVDSWDWGSNDYDRFQIQFDNLPVIEGYGVNSLTGITGLTDVCGASNWKDLPGIKVSGWIAHTSLTLNLKFSVYFDEFSNNESFGVRDLELIFANDNPGANYICAYTSSNVVLQNLQNHPVCACEPGKYSPTGISSGCTSCSQACASCYALGADKCIACADYYYFDGSQCSQCDSSCVRCTGPESNKCTKCALGFALFSGRCILSSRCSSSPFTMDYSPDECYSPCSLATLASWTDSCYPPCPASSIIDIDLNGACQSCTSLSVQYLKATDDGYQFTFQLSPSSCDLSIENVRRYLTVTEKIANSVDSFSYQVTKTAANNYLVDLVLDQSLIEAISFDLKLSYLTGSLDVPKRFSPICTSLNTQYLKATNDGYQYNLQLSPSSCDLTIENVRRYLTITEVTVGSVPSFSFQATKTSANHYLISLTLDQSVIEAIPFDVKLSFMTGFLNVPKRFSPICKSLSSQYLRATDEGHQYTFHLSPSSCDLSIENVRRYLILTEHTPNAVGPFTFRVTKTSANNYLINLVLDQSILEETSLDLKLSFMTGSLDVPKKFVLDGTLKAIAAAVPTITAGFSGMLGGSFVSTLALGATAGLWSIVSFQQFVGYFLFINVEYPPILELFLSMLQVSFWDLLPNPLAALTDSLSADLIAQDKMAVTPYDPPKKFVNYEMNSFFIENGGAIIAVNLFLLILLGQVLLLKRVNAWRKNIVLVKLKVWIKWNLIARIFLENGIPLSLAVFLQLRIATFDHSYLIMCFAATIISLLNICIFVFFFWKVLLQRKNEHLNKKMTKRMFGTLYEGIVLGKTFSKYYNVVILVRGILLMGLITFFEANPIVQIFPLIIFNAALVVYMFKQVAFENKKLDFIVKLKEILILLGEIGMIFLCFKVDSENYYKILGYLIVSSLGIALVAEVGYMMILQICEIKNLWKKIKVGWNWLMKLRAKENKVEKIKMRPSHRLRNHHQDLSQSSSELIVTQIS